MFRVPTYWTPRWVSSLFPPSSPSHLISSRLVSSRLVSSRLVSSRLVSSHVIGLISSHLSSAHLITLLLLLGTCSSSQDVSRNVSWAGSKLPGPEGSSDWCSSGNLTLNQKEGINSYRAKALTSVMSKWYATCIILRLEEEKEPGEMKQLHLGGIDGICCQRL